jgi:hypothetical protein
LHGTENKYASVLFPTPKISLITFAAYLCSEEELTLLEQLVEELCQHVSDDSLTVRSLCLRGLVQVIILSTAWIPVLSLDTVLLL